MGASTERYLIWDFDGTLATRPGEWTATLCETLSSHRPGLHVDPERIRPHLRTGFPWHAPESVRTPCSADDWWENLLPVFEAAFVGAGVDRQEASGLARRVRMLYTEPSRWKVYDDALPVLEELRGRGWRHLMLSNHVPELARLATVLGLHSYFTAIYCSADTGVEKPNPEAFERVFADYPRARDGWMIGDSWSADVQGASRVGLRSILVRRTHADASCRCESLHEVVSIVSQPRLVKS